MLRFRFVALIAIASILAAAAAAKAQQFSQQGAKLLGSGATGNPTLGTAVALSADGDTMIVGGPSDNSSYGAVWVYVRSNGVWVQQGPKLTATGNVGAAGFGYSAALSSDGNTAVIGGFHDNSQTGAAWIFTRSNGIWSQQQKIVGTGATGPQGAAQGHAVAISADGNTVLSGGYADATQAGAVWVFTRSSGVWTQQGAKLAGAGEVGGGYFGWSVALSGDGDTAIAGGVYDATHAGAAWVFTRSNGVWSPQGAKLVGAGGVNYPEQGQSVALSTDGNTALVGAFGDNSGTGATWVWTRLNGVWSQQGAKLVGSGPVGAAQQGYSVALSGDGATALIGGYSDNGNAGAAWVFTRANGVWSPQGAKLVGSMPAGLAQQGSSVALSADGGTAAIGGPQDNSTAGATWVFSEPHWQVAATADLNGDSDSDLLLTQSGGTGVVAAWLTNGLATPSGVSIGLTDGTWTFLAAGRFRTATATDLFLFQPQSGTIALWETSGATVTAGLALGALPAPWQISGFGDFNNDGVSDILIRNAQTGDIGVWYLNGGAITAGAVLGTVGSNWTIAGTGDFTGAGYADILWRDLNSGAVAIWLVGGTASAPTVTGLSVGTVSLDWQIAGVADFNGDGKADILLRRQSTGDIGVWLMYGSSVTTSGVLGNVSSDWRIVGVADINGDHISDILWRQQSSAAVAAWRIYATATTLAAGTAVTGSATLGFLP